MLADFISHHAEIVLIVILCVLAILFMLMACLAAGSSYINDDEDQMRYLAEWKKRKEGTKK